MSTSSITSGIQAFSNAVQRAQTSATQIAQNSTKGSSADLLAPLIDLKVAEQQATTAAKVIQAGNAQVGTLLDMLA